MEQSAQASSSSAEQPAPNVADIQRWLSTDELIESKIDTTAIREAVAVLTTTPAPKRHDVQPLLHKWGIVQKEAGKKRSLQAVVHDLEQTVRDAAAKMKQDLASMLSLIHI